MNVYTIEYSTGESVASAVVVATTLEAAWALLTAKHNAQVEDNQVDDTDPRITVFCQATVGTESQATILNDGRYP